MGVKDIMVVLERATDAEARADLTHSLADGFNAESTVVVVVQQGPQTPSLLG